MHVLEEIDMGNRDFVAPYLLGKGVSLSCSSLNTPLHSAARRTMHLTLKEISHRTILGSATNNSHEVRVLNNPFYSSYIAEQPVQRCLKYIYIYISTDRVDVP